MFHLKRYFLLKLFDEFIFFFSTFYALSIIFSVTKYMLEFGTVNYKLVISTSTIFSPFVILSAFFFSLYETIKKIYNKIVLLETFGEKIKRIFITIFMLSVFVFSVELLLIFKVVPKSFKFNRENYAEIIRAQAKKYKEMLLLPLSGKLMVAEDIKINQGEIRLYNGFIYDGNNSMNFKEMRINIPSTDSRFSKDFVELILDEGEKGKREIIYSISYSASSISCAPYFLFFIGSPAPLLCFPFLLAGSKLLRDTAKSNNTLLLLYFVIHIATLLIGICLMTKKKFIK